MTPFAAFRRAVSTVLAAGLLGCFLPDVVRGQTPTAADMKQLREDSAQAMGLIQQLHRLRKHDPAWFKATIADAGLPPGVRRQLLLALQHYYRVTGYPDEVFNLVEAWHKELNPGQVLLFERGPRPFKTIVVQDPVQTVPLVLQHFRPLRLPVLNGMELSGLKILRGFYRDGRFWIEARCDKAPITNPAFPNFALLYALDLAKGEEDVILFEPSRPKAPCVEVLRQHVFIKARDRLKTYDLATKTQRDFPLIADEQAQLVTLDERLFLVSSNSLSFLDRRTGSSLLMASVRRRPPQTPLDALPSLAPALLLPGPGNTLRFQAGDSVYIYGQNRLWTKEFTLGTDALALHSAVVPLADGRQGGLMVMAPRQQLGTGPANRIFSLAPDGTSPELLLGPPPAARLPSMPAPPPEPKPRWSMQYTSLAVDASYVWLGQDLWAASSAGNPQQKNFTGLQLYCFRSEPNGICSFPTTFADTAENREDFEREHRVFRQYQLVNLPEGLAALSLQGAGYWFIPSADLTTALKAVK